MRWPWVGMLVAVVLGAVACTNAPPQAVVSDGVPPEIERSRTLLGSPLVAVAESAAVLAEDLDTVRHQMDRGDDMLGGLKAVRQDIGDLRRVANDLLAAARIAPYEEAAGVAREAVSDALAAADAAQAEMAYLRAVARIDVRLLDVAEGWDWPGSQTEQRERLAAEDAVIARIARDIRSLAHTPKACQSLSENRAAWARTVRARTRKLADQANSFGGTRYDELRDQYRDEPFGEDALAADARDRACWSDNSDAASTAADLRGRVEQLEDVLA